MKRLPLTLSLFTRKRRYDILDIYKPPAPYLLLKEAVMYRKK